VAGRQPDKRVGSGLRAVAQKDTDQPPSRPPPADKVFRPESRPPVAAATSRTAVYLSLIPITPGYDDEGRGERETGQCRPSVVRFWDIGLAARTNELTRESIKEALRVYLQPIMHQERRPAARFLHHMQTKDGGARYRIHAEMQRGPQHHLDLAFLQSRFRCTALTAFIGWCVLCGQLRLRHRRSINASPSAPTSRNRRRKVTCGCGESRFPRRTKLECISDTGEPPSGPG